jgi:iron complex transport system permease protein
MTTPDPADAPAPAPGATPRSARAIPGIRGALLALAVGVAAAVLGLLPWIVAGLRLLPQDLWAEDIATAADMPLALLPFDLHSAALLAAVIVVGGGIAGTAARLLRPRLPRAGAWLVLAGLLLVQVVALVQTATVTADGLGVDDMRPPGVDPTGAGISEAQVQLVALVAGTIAAILVGAVVALVLALAPAGVAVVAVALPAVLLGAWIRGGVPPVDGFVRPPGPALLVVARWTPPVVLGLAIAATGLRGDGRIVGAVLATVLLWLGQAAVIAVSSALGSGALLRHPLELADFARAVFVAALGPPTRVLPELAATVLVGVLGALVVRAIPRRRAVSAA